MLLYCDAKVIKIQTKFNCKIFGITAINRYLCSPIMSN